MAFCSKIVTLLRYALVPSRSSSVKKEIVPDFFTFLFNSLSLHNIHQFLYPQSQDNENSFLGQFEQEYDTYTQDQKDFLYSHYQESHLIFL